MLMAQLPTIICSNPNCNYKGRPIRKAKGSRLVAILLLVVFLPIGLIYLLLNSGYRCSCPRCNNEIRLG